MDKPKMMVGLRTADHVVEVPGTKDGFSCSGCKEPISLAPSGVKYIDANPGTELICTKCFAVPLEEVKPMLAPGGEQEIEEFVKHYRRN